MTISGSDYIVVSQPTNVVASSSGTTSFTIEFQPAGPTGIKNGSVSIFSDDADENPYDISLIGNSVQTVASIQINNQITCNGETDVRLTALATGGVTPYTFAWNTGGTTATENNLSAGTYTVTVTDFIGSIGTASTTLVQPNILIASANTGNNESCIGVSDGTAIASATGGTAPYSYIWNTGGLQP